MERDCENCGRARTLVGFEEWEEMDLSIYSDEEIDEISQEYDEIVIWRCQYCGYETE